MGRNLSTLNIKDTYEGLVQISGSILTDGTGSVIPSIEATASFATSASYAVNSDTAISSSYVLSSSYSETSTSASHAVNSDTSISSSYALTASYAENVLAPNLQEVTTVGNSTNLPISSSTIFVDGVRTYEVDAINSQLANRVFMIKAGGGTNSTLQLYPDSIKDAGITLNNTTGVQITGSLKNAGLIYPTADGTVGQAVVTDGGGNLTFGTVTSPTPTLQEVTTVGAVTTDDITLSGSLKMDVVAAGTVYFETERDGNDQVRLVSNNSLNSIVLNQSGSQQVKVDFSNSAGEIESSGDLTLDTSGNTVVIPSKLDVQTALTASGLFYPTVDGTAGQVIETDGAGTLSFATAGGATPNLQQVLDEGSIATGSIELYDVAFNESLLLDFNTNGGSVLSGRGNSILNLGVNQAEAHFKWEPKSGCFIPHEPLSIAGEKLPWE
jgi:hypothetical protein